MLCSRLEPLPICTRYNSCCMSLILLPHIKFMHCALTLLCLPQPVARCQVPAPGVTPAAMALNTFITCPTQPPTCAPAHLRPLTMYSVNQDLMSPFPPLPGPHALQPGPLPAPAT